MDEDLKDFVIFTVEATRYGKIGMSFSTDAFNEFEKPGNELKSRSRKINNGESIKIFKMSEL